MTDAAGSGPRRWLARLHALEDGLLALLLGGMILVACAQILLRNTLGWNFAWGDPLVRQLVLWVGLLGAVAASRGNRHISVDIASHLLSGRLRSAVQAITCLFTVLVCAAVTWHAARFVLDEYTAGSRGLWQLPVAGFQLIIPLGFALIGLRYALQLLLHLQALRRPPA